MPRDLEFIPSEDLITELLRRSVCGLVVIQSMPSPDDGDVKLRFRTTPNLMEALRLLRAAEDHTIKGLLDPDGDHFVREDLGEYEDEDNDYNYW